MIRILCADITSADERIYKSLYERASEERKRRADRYLRQEDKIRCVTADALLRIALGTEIFQIQENEFGKPYIKNQKNFYYNLSHSGNCVVLAWGNGEVGVDVQQHRADTDMRIIAENCFADDEKEYIMQSDRQTEERFYEIWTGKESYLKYVGKGLRGNMRSLSILQRKSEILFLPHFPQKGYSLSLCAAQKDYTFELLDIKQLR